MAVDGDDAALFMQLVTVGDELQGLRDYGTRG
jgi:hypothetical protein